MNSSTEQKEAARPSLHWLGRHLPSEPGMYWWRRTDAEDWRVVSVMAFGEHLTAYDIQHHLWMGRTLSVWQDNSETIGVGEWVRIPVPT